MFQLIQAWFRRYFADPQASVLLLMVIFAIVIIAGFGAIIAPLIAGLVLAYLLDAVIEPLNRFCRLPRWLAISVVFLVFVGVLVLFFLWFVPLIYRQMSQFLAEVPSMIAGFHLFLRQLPERYPAISHHAVANLIDSTRFSPEKLAGLTKTVVSFSINSLPNIFTWVVYLFLVPLLALFFIKDKVKIIEWCMQFAPKDRGLLIKVWHQMKVQLGNYVRGKALEVIIVWVATFIGMRVFDLNYATLLAFFVGLSVIIPYIGIVLATIPVVVVGMLQFGIGATFWWMIVVYSVVQILDGFLLVPLLYSEAVNLNPIAILAAVLFFGGLWGFWGLFFAIPLATLVNSLICAWIQHANEGIV